MKLIIVIFFILYSSFVNSATEKFTMGVGIHPTSYDLSPNQLVDLLNKYKMQITRYDYPWPRVEAKRNSFNSPGNKLDDLVTLNYQNNIKTILILGGVNTLYGGGRPITTDNRKAFSNYVAWVAQRFKNKNIIYEIWNEWPYGKNFDGIEPSGKESARLYVELVKEASEAIRKEDSSATIIAGGVNPLNDKFDSWTEEIFNLGINDFIDGLSIHPYSYQNRVIAEPEYNVNILDKLQKKIVQQLGIESEYPFYVTEFGYPDYVGGINLPSELEGEYIKDYFIALSKRNYIKSALWYDFINDGDDKSEKEDNFGLLDSSYNEKNDMVAFLAAFEKINRQVINEK